MAGPTDAKTAFVRNNILTVVDGRGHIWHYDAAIKQGAAGEDIVAPADFARAEYSGGSVMVIDSGGAVWLFDLNTGVWRKGPQADENLPDEDKNTTNPWKRGHNVLTPAVEPEAKESKAA